MRKKKPQREILVFQTNIKSPDDVKSVGKTLNNLPDIFRWTVDLLDWERVLRVEAQNSQSKYLIQYAVISAGYHCEELNH